MEKRVTFGVVHPHDVHFISSRRDMPKDEHCKIWYPESKIDDFKYHARTLSRTLRSHDTSPSCSQCITSKHPMDDGSIPECCGTALPTSQMAIALNRMRQQELSQPSRPSLDHGCSQLTPPSQCDYFRRGLEHRICLERQFKRHVAMKSILRFHRDNKSNSPGLSIVAKRNTRWAKSVALQTGIQDAKDAAHDYVDFFCGKTATGMASSPAPLTRKRTLSEIATTTVQQMNHETAKPESVYLRRPAQARAA